MGLMRFTACLLSLAVWGFLVLPHTGETLMQEVRKYYNKVGGQHCETTNGGKRHLAGIIFETTLIFLVD